MATAGSPSDLFSGSTTLSAPSVTYNSPTGTTKQALPPPPTQISKFSMLPDPTSPGTGTVPKAFQADTNVSGPGTSIVSGAGATPAPSTKKSTKKSLPTTPATPATIATGLTGGKITF